MGDRRSAVDVPEKPQENSDRSASVVTRGTKSDLMMIPGVPESPVILACVALSSGLWCEILW